MYTSDMEISIYLYDVLPFKIDFLDLLIMVDVPPDLEESPKGPSMLGMLWL